MEAKAFFSAMSGNIRLETRDENGTRRIYFERTSDLVNYCEQNGIALRIDDCLGRWAQ